jgi:hypothetical protein
MNRTKKISVKKHAGDTTREKPLKTIIAKSASFKGITKPQAKAALGNINTRMVAGQPGKGVSKAEKPAKAASAQKPTPVTPDYIIRDKVLFDIIAERNRQSDVEGFYVERDDKYINGELARAAAAYALPAGFPVGTESGKKILRKPIWPWDRSWYKPTTPRRDLIKAAALIIAELERLDRAEAKTPIVIIESGAGYEALVKAVGGTSIKIPTGSPKVFKNIAAKKKLASKKSKN